MTATLRLLLKNTDFASVPLDAELTADQLTEVYQLLVGQPVGRLGLDGEPWTLSRIADRLELGLARHAD